MADEPIYGLHHLIDIPKVDLVGIFHHLRHTGVLRDDRQDSPGHGLQRCDPEGLGDGGHHEDVGASEDELYLLVVEETREEEPVPEPVGSGSVDHLVHHVPSSGHDEVNLRVLVVNPGSHLEEVVRSLLKGDPPQEEDSRVFEEASRTNLPVLLCGRVGVVDHPELTGIDGIPGVDHFGGIVGNRNDPVRGLHPRPFDPVNPLVPPSSGTVEFGRMDV